MMCATNKNKNNDYYVQIVGVTFTSNSSYELTVRVRWALIDGVLNESKLIIFLSTALVIEEFQ
jgi:hypothetical protein